MRPPQFAAPSVLAALLAALLAGCTAPLGDFVPEGQRVDAPTRIVFLGDSITDEDEGDAVTTMWPSLLLLNDDEALPGLTGHDLATRLPSVVQSHNVAVSGATSDDLQDQLDDLAQRLGEPPWGGQTLVAVTIGGNDLNDAEMEPGVGERAARAVNANLAALHSWLSDPARFPDGALLYAANVYDPSGRGDTAGGGCFEGVYPLVMDEVISTFNRRLLAGAEAEGYAMLDLYGLFRPHGLGRTEPEAVDAGDPEASIWFADCLHPNLRGHSEIRGLFLRAMTERGTEEPAD